MSNFKHSKLKNTGLLFEFLLRQVTVDVLNKQKNSKALQIIKKRFNENTEVGKELALYTALMNKKFKSDKKADYFLECADEMINKDRRINNEFYLDIVLDECILKKQKVQVFEIDDYICWGTPKDLQNYLEQYE